MKEPRHVLEESGTTDWLKGALFCGVISRVSERASERAVWTRGCWLAVMRTEQLAKKAAASLAGGGLALG